jgi:hypothetical protein
MVGISVLPVTFLLTTSDSPQAGFFGPKGVGVTAKASEKWGVVPTVLGGLRSRLTLRQPT